MALTITALLADPSGKPIVNLEVQALTFSTAGTAKVIGTGRTGVDGTLSITTSFVAAADYQPRVKRKSN